MHASERHVILLIQLDVCGLLYQNVSSTFYYVYISLISMKLIRKKKKSSNRLKASIYYCICVNEKWLTEIILIMFQFI